MVGVGRRQMLVTWQKGVPSVGGGVRDGWASDAGDVAEAGAEGGGRSWWGRV